MERERFLMELEFVQCLANPLYLNCKCFLILSINFISIHSRMYQDKYTHIDGIQPDLAQQGLLSDPVFVQYLEYLLYWTQPQYALYIEYPYALEMLRLLQTRSFRDACLSLETATFLHRTEYAQWKHPPWETPQRQEETL
jgi:mediator of RNA polymerase II transcription subunit 31